MNWSNKNKKIRRAEWHTSPPPHNDKRKAAHLWCKHYPSDGLFYHHYTNTRWWFEKAEDAIIFALKHSE